MINILMCDDHPVVREGLKGVLSAFDDIAIKSEASSCSEVLERVREESFDIVLLDVKMPDRLGLDVIEEIRAEKPDLPVLMFSAYPEEQYGITAMKSGAAGYLMKEGSPREWIKAIRIVSSGGKYISSTLAERLEAYLQSESRVMLHEKLSSREYQVMYMISLGESVSDIADKLKTSLKMVHQYQARAFKKMKMVNSVQFFRYATKHKLLDS